jgi:tripartite-type tricarboxylate transporter receptor subunit TctC
MPFPPGGTVDVVTRLACDEAGRILGKPLVLEYKAGAGGIIATEAGARAAPDGYTIVIATPNHTINPALRKKLPYDTEKDFVPVSLIATVPELLVAHPSVPFDDLKGFLAYAKANPGKLNYASAGNGSATHLAMAYFAGLAGLDMVHIPLKSTGDAVNEVLAGRSQAVIAATIGAIPFAQDPRVRVLAVTGAHRSRFLPDPPAVAQSGLPDYTFDSWMGLLGPAGMPKAAVEQINAAVASLLKDPAILERLARQGVEPQAMSPDAFGALLRGDVAKMARVVKLSGARID